MRVAVMLAVSLSCAGCMLDAAPAGDGDQDIGEALEAMSSFTSAFHFLKAYTGMTVFTVPNNGVVTVTASASWRGPAARCRLPTYMIEPVGTAILGPHAGERTYPATGAMHTETWSGLAAGTYKLSFQTLNDDTDCALWGTVRVSIKP